jgi:hypothetical protein
MYRRAADALEGRTWFWTAGIKQAQIAWAYHTTASWGVCMPWSTWADRRSVPAVPVHAVPTHLQPEVVQEPQHGGAVAPGPGCSRAPYGGATGHVQSSREYTGHTHTHTHTHNTHTTHTTHTHNTQALHSPEAPTGPLKHKPLLLLRPQPASHTRSSLQQCHCAMAMLAVEWRVAW